MSEKTKETKAEFRARMIRQCMEQIERLQMHIKAHEAACRVIWERHRDAKLSNDVHRALVAMELDAWRDLSMWALTLDDAERDRIKAAAYARFLGDGKDMGRWLSEDGTPVSSWSCADEEHFRAMARELFQP